MLSVQLNSLRFVTDQNPPLISVKCSVRTDASRTKGYIMPMIQNNANQCLMTEEISKVMKMKSHNCTFINKKESQGLVTDFSNTSNFIFNIANCGDRLFISVKIFLLKNDKNPQDHDKFKSIVCIENDFTDKTIPLIFDNKLFCVGYLNLKYIFDLNANNQYPPNMNQQLFNPNLNLNPQMQGCNPQHPDYLMHKCQIDHQDVIRFIEYYNRNFLVFFIFSKKITQDDFKENIVNPIKNEETAKSIWSSNYFDKFPPLAYDFKNFPKLKDYPLFFEETTVHNFNYPLQPLNQNLFVFAHGFKGNAQGWEPMSRYLGIVFPNSYFLCSSSNEKDTEQSLLNMGRNLAKEVEEFIQNKKIENSIIKINFIGHSLGGLIIRNALPFLEKYKNKMNTFATLSSQHFGFKFTSSVLTDIGIFGLRTFHNCDSLKEASMTDNSFVRNTLLYRLAFKDGVQWFKNYIFATSEQDTYTPFESARLEVCPEGLNSSWHRDEYVEMVDELKAKVINKNIVKLNVIFPENESYGLIERKSGLAVHMQLVFNEKYCKIFAFRYGALFN